MTDTQTKVMRAEADPRHADTAAGISGTLVFLRAVNVGARQFPSADIRRVVTELGFSDVATHAASGNVFFRGGPTDRAEREQLLEAAFAADRGFEVPVISFTPDEFRAVADIADEITSVDLSRHYIYLLKDDLTPDVLLRIAGKETDAGRVIVRGRAAHVLLGDGYVSGNVDPLNVARLFGIATNRNLNVVRTLAEKWAGR